VLYEEYDYKSSERIKAYYTAISLVRRLFMITVLMRLKNYASIQMMLFIFSSVFSLATLVALRPYKDASTNRIEILNEFTVYINTQLTQVFLTNTQDS